jgi:hypothetical protein
MTAATVLFTHQSNYNGWVMEFEGEDVVIGWGDVDQYDPVLDYLIDWSSEFADEDGDTQLEVSDITDEVKSTVLAMIESTDGSATISFEIDCSST